MEYWKARAARLSLLVGTYDQIYLFVYTYMTKSIAPPPSPPPPLTSSPPHLHSICLTIWPQVDQISNHQCKMVLVTLKAAQCKILKVEPLQKECSIPRCSALQCRVKECTALQCM